MICLGIVAGLSWSCPDPTEPPRPTSVSLSSTQVDLDALSATEQLTAQVLDQNGQPMPEEVVTWSSGNPAVATVSAAGLVTAIANGTGEVMATSGSLSATAVVDVAQVVATLEKAAGDAQSGTVGQALSEAVVVRALDRLNNPVVSTSVSFTVASGGGSASPASGNTNAQGRASTTWTLGTSTDVAQQLDATHADGAPAASFSATANAAAPGSTEKIQGDAQTGAAATALPDSIVVRIVDAFGNPVAGQTVNFAVSAGGGSASPASADSDAGGRAATQWTLGSGLGANTLQATVAGLTPATFNATSVTGPPTSLTKEAGDNQFAQVSTAVAIPPAVKISDAGGNPVADVEVSFAVASGGGSITGELAMTDAAGLAAVGSWTVGPNPGTNELTATVSGLAALTFTATGTTDAVAANIEKEAGDNQSATVNTAVAIAPTVKLTDASMNPVAGVLVTFEVASGGGSITGATVASDVDGLAAVGSWTLGTAAGPNTLTATTLGLAPVTFTAMGTAGPPTNIAIDDGDGQTGLVGFGVNIPPSVLVTDVFGNPVADETVTFTVMSGGGSVTDGTPLTDSVGIAAVGKWTLGASPATNTLDASASGTGTVTFTADGVNGAYDIDLRFLTSLSPEQEQTFLDAGARWEELLYGELSDIPIVLPAGSCGANSPPLDETVDDLLILATVEPIDGPGGILGQAGPCAIRTSNSLPLLGLMRFDSADVAGLEASGQFDEVILHEMGHVIGYGTVWNALGLLADPSLAGGTDPHFIGMRANEAFDRVGGENYGGATVPVENLGGPGTADAHWRESVFNNELMTGFLNGGANPLSEVSVASLWDMGYTANLDGADFYMLPMALRAPGRPVTLRLVDDIARVTIYIIDSSGRIVGELTRR